MKKDYVRRNLCRCKLRLMSFWFISAPNFIDFFLHPLSLSGLTNDSKWQNDFRYSNFIMLRSASVFKPLMVSCCTLSSFEFSWDKVIFSIAGNKVHCSRAQRGKQLAIELGKHEVSSFESENFLSPFQVEFIPQKEFANKLFMKLRPADFSRC